jgi:DNA-binding transcriptional ArsR family regulator
LAELLGALSHPHRIRIVEELRGRELDVNSIQLALGISHSAVSQNLAIMRAHKLVRERREGRRMIYSLADPELAGWLLGGLSFIECEIEQTARKRDAVEAVRAIWSSRP